MLSIPLIITCILSPARGTREDPPADPRADSVIPFLIHVVKYVTQDVEKNINRMIYVYLSARLYFSGAAIRNFVRNGELLDSRRKASILRINIAVFEERSDVFARITGWLVKIDGIYSH